MYELCSKRKINKRTTHQYMNQNHMTRWAERFAEWQQSGGFSCLATSEIQAVQWAKTWMVDLGWP